jgi:hypothetical protein
MKKNGKSSINQNVIFMISKKNCLCHFDIWPKKVVVLVTTDD